mgnify:CR=1 FL=1
MKSYKSIGLTLDDVVSNLEYEQLVFQNLKRCYRFASKQFRVVFWNDKLTETEIKNFVKRNQDILFEFSTQITSKKNRNKFDSIWFIIEDGECKINHRYQWKGDILSGLAEFTKIIRFLNKKEGSNESGNHRK